MSTTKKHVNFNVFINNKHASATLPTGTATNPNGNPKWSKPFGTVTYQDDAFIVIKNITRNPVIPSKPNEST